jgi:parallel beta-helix repeat protein
MNDLGAGGVRIGETALPGNPEEQAERNELLNCFIHDGGHVYHAGIGAWIGMSSHNKVLHNEICDLLYSGVSVGWSWGYAPTSAHHNAIEYNHIHHLGWSQLSDMGGVYSLGVSPGTTVRHNLIHDVASFSYGGWGLYTDEGSSNILLENNIVYRVKDGCFHQHYGRENIVRNNIFAFSAINGQILRSREESHRSFNFERNIVYYKQANLLTGNWGNGQYVIDRNCYWNAAGKTPTFPGGLTFQQWQAKGHDVHSVIADPKFVDPARFDFRLQNDSPALRLGFQPIDASTIGLVGPPEWVALPKQVERPPLKLPGDP